MAGVEFWLARAMQVAMLTREQIETVHHKERQLGYCLSNWNIQNLTGADPVSKYWGVGSELSAIQRHNDRIRKRIFELKIFSEIPRGGHVEALDVATTHLFDNIIRLRAEEIDFAFEKPTRPKRTKSLLAELEAM